ncbi:MAG: SDR family oxidoreductase [Candidatus Dadabacteria bacterium]|nr:SDR family oxidoreductase [Candidatus Dadabacteria bacterium]
MNQTALITGGSKRLGKAISLEVAKKGYNIALHYNSSQIDAENTKKEIKEFGVDCKTFKCDLSDINQVLKLIPKVSYEMPDLTVLVNNASIFDDIKFTDVTPDFFDKDFTINFKSPFFLTQTFAKNTKKGQVINLLDTRVNRTTTQHFVYNLSKKSLYNFTRMAAKELAPDIRVNGICPGPILPPPGKDEKYLTDIIKVVPLKMIGNIEVVLKAFNYLFENNFVTGECLFVDGGKHLNY